MIRYFSLGFILLLTACMSTPKQLESPGLAIANKTILADKTGAYYFITLDLADEIPDNTYAVVNYQDLENPDQTRSLDLGGIQDARRLNFKSRPVKRVYAKREYHFEVVLFSRASQAEIVAVRSATVRPNIPAKIANLFGISLL